MIKDGALKQKITLVYGNRSILRLYPNGMVRKSPYDGKPHGGFYTQTQIRNIIKYASERHITIIPEIEMPGHSAAAIAAYPWLSATRKRNKSTLQFRSSIRRVQCYRSESFEFS